MLKKVSTFLLTAILTLGCAASAWAADINSIAAAYYSDASGSKLEITEDGEYIESGSYKDCYVSEDKLIIVEDGSAERKSYELIDNKLFIFDNEENGKVFSKTQDRNDVRIHSWMANIDFSLADWRKAFGFETDEIWNGYIWEDCELFKGIKGQLRVSYYSSGQLNRWRWDTYVNDDEYDEIRNLMKWIGNSQYVDSDDYEYFYVYGWVNFKEGNFDPEWTVGNTTIIESGEWRGRKHALVLLVGEDNYVSLQYDPLNCKDTSSWTYNPFVFIDKPEAETETIEETIAETEAVTVEETMAETEAVTVEETMAETEAVTVEETMAETEAVTVEEATAETETVLLDNEDVPVFIIATDMGFAPFEFQDKDANVVGIDLDIMRAIAKDQGFGVEIQYIGWDAAIAACQSGQADAMIAGISITKAREESGWIFSDGYYDAAQGMAVNVKSDITGFEDLKGQTVAVKRGTMSDSYASELSEIYDFTVQQFDTSPDIYQAVMGGQCAACFDDTPILKYNIKANELPMKYVPGSENESIAYGLAIFNAEKQEIINMFNAGLANIKENGTYDEIIAKYLGE